MFSAIICKAPHGFDIIVVVTTKKELAIKALKILRLDEIDKFLECHQIIRFLVSVLLQRISFVEATRNSSGVMLSRSV